MDAMLRELGELWEDLQRKHQENGAVLREIDKVSDRHHPHVAPAVPRPPDVWPPAWLLQPCVAGSRGDGAGPTSPLSPQALRLVGELDRAERWLQAVAGSLSEPAAMRSPAELRRDLEGTGQLERQLLLCGIKLQALREEAAGETPAEHEGARKMQRKVEMVEEK